MIILGLLFLAAAAVAAVELIVANDGGQISVHMWRWSWTVEPFWLVVAGAAVLAAALLGLLMLKAGSGRARRLRRERRELAKENRRLAGRAELAEGEAVPVTDAEPVRDGAPDGYAHPPHTVSPTAVQTDQNAYAGAREQRYTGEPEGRHVET